MNKYRIRPLIREEASGLFPPIQISGKVLFVKPGFIQAIRFDEEEQTYYVDLLIRYRSIADVPLGYQGYEDRPELFDPNEEPLLIVGEEEYPPPEPTEMELYHQEVSKALKQIAKIVKNKVPNLSSGQINKLNNIIDYFKDN